MGVSSDIGLPNLDIPGPSLAMVRFLDGIPDMSGKSRHFQLYHLTNQQILIVAYYSLSQIPMCLMW